MFSTVAPANVGCQWVGRCLHPVVTDTDQSAIRYSHATFVCRSTKPGPPHQIGSIAQRVELAQTNPESARNVVLLAVTTSRQLLAKVLSSTRSIGQWVRCPNPEITNYCRRHRVAARESFSGAISHTESSVSLRTLLVDRFLPSTMPSLDWHIRSSLRPTIGSHVSA